jgi:hypothetical protein
MDPVSLTAFLAPFLPYLMKGVQDLTEEAGRKLGQQGWKHAKALWERLRPGVDDDDAAHQAAEAVAAQPDDELARGGLAFQLGTLLKSDPQLAEEITRLWKEAEAAHVVVVGERGVGVGGSVADSTIVTGDDVSIEK